MKNQSFAKPPAPVTAHHSIVRVSIMAIGLGAVSGLVAPALTRLIGFVTNLAFYGRVSDSFISPADNHLGPWVIVIPAIGGILVGIMARYGSKAIRGHGIPEAMEQVLENDSRIPVRIVFLKPISAAISIGTGGPFGAEGPIIATGGALGSALGQFISTTAAERKTLLAAGAAAGMAAIFGSPVSAVLLAIELLLFEFRARSFVPVALAAATAAGMRISLGASGAIFAMPNVAPVSLVSLGLYALIGVAMGVLAAGVIRAVYWTEDMFEHLPVHWMWWPAIGGIAVGAIGWLSPRTLGVGYDNISGFLSNEFPLRVMVCLTLFKFVSWAISLGSGTSGGTLAPLLTIGGGTGGLLGIGLSRVLPGGCIDTRMAALVGMAAMFAGASGALLASVVFAFETTLQPNALLPILAGSTLAFLTTRLLMENSIMTEKIARRGLRIPRDYDPDAFSQTTVREIMETEVHTLPLAQTVSSIAALIAKHDPSVAQHHAWPLVDATGALAGMITRGDIYRALEKTGGEAMTLLQAGSGEPVTAWPEESVHDAVARMLVHGVGRLPVVDPAEPRKIVGYLSRTNLIRIRLKNHRQENVRDAGWLRTRKLTPGGGSA